MNTLWSGIVSWIAMKHRMPYTQFQWSNPKRNERRGRFGETAVWGQCMFFPYVFPGGCRDGGGEGSVVIRVREWGGGGGGGGCVITLLPLYSHRIRESHQATCFWLMSANMRFNNFSLDREGIRRFIYCTLESSWKALATQMSYFMPIKQREPYSTVVERERVCVCVCVCDRARQEAGESEGEKEASRQ